MKRGWGQGPQALGTEAGLPGVLHRRLGQEALALDLGSQGGWAGGHEPGEAAQGEHHVLRRRGTKETMTA